MSLFDGILIDSNIIIDNFQRPVSEYYYSPDGYQCNYVYFCSHAHTDHMIGLSSTWCRGIIYCSEITRELLLIEYPSLTNYIKSLPTEQSSIIELVLTNKNNNANDSNNHNSSACSKHETFSVSLFPSNHCPGSVLFLFQGLFGTILYTGDYRYDSTQYDFHLLNQVRNYRIDYLYSDVTFCSRALVLQRDFPSYKQSIQSIINSCDKYLSQYKNNDNNNNSSILPRIYIACESLGTERILLALFKHFNYKIYVNPTQFSKRIKQLNCFIETNSAIDIITIDESSYTPFHLCSSSQMQQFAQYDGKLRQENKTNNPALFLKPSTMWFVHNMVSAGSILSPLAINNNIVVNTQSSLFNHINNNNYSSTLGLGNSMNKIAQLAVASNLKSSAVNELSNKSKIDYYDRFGVLHILYSQHSSCNEVLEFVNFIKPKLFIPINTPAALLSHDKHNHHLTTITSTNNREFQVQQELAELFAESPLFISNNIRTQVKGPSQLITKMNNNNNTAPNQFNTPIHKKRSAALVVPDQNNISATRDFKRIAIFNPVRLSNNSSVPITKLNNELFSFPPPLLQTLGYNFNWNKFRYCKVFIMNNINGIIEREQLKQILIKLQAVPVNSINALFEPIIGYKAHSSCALIITNGLLKAGFPLYFRLTLALLALKIKQINTNNNQHPNNSKRTINIPIIYIYQSSVIDILHQHCNKFKELQNQLPNELIEELNNNIHFIWNSMQFSEKQMQNLIEEYEEAKRSPVKSSYPSIETTDYSFMNAKNNTALYDQASQTNYFTATNSLTIHQQQQNTQY